MKNASFRENVQPQQRPMPPVQNIPPQQPVAPVQNVPPQQPVAPVQNVRPPQVPVPPMQNMPQPPIPQQNQLFMDEPAKENTVTIAKVLPFVFSFMIIIGALWILKIMNDFGLFTAALKVTIFYVGSIGIFVLAKLKISHGLLRNLAYGVSFVLCILTTAAGVLLYDLIPFNMGLVIGLLY